MVPTLVNGLGMDRHRVAPTGRPAQSIRTSDREAILELRGLDASFAERSTTVMPRVIRTAVPLAALAACLAFLAIAASPASAILYRVKPGHWVSYESRQGKPTPHTSPKSLQLSSSSNYEIFNGSLGYLNYSGGPVMPSSTDYVFVWSGSNYSGSPFGSGSNCGFADSNGNYNTPCSSYAQGVNTYFQDLAAASGSSNNSNAVSTQY